MTDTKNDIKIHCQYETLVSIDDLKPHPQNPNTHPHKQIALLAKNIRHMGWRHPVIVSDLTGFVVAGHARIEAAALLDISIIPVDFQPFDSETEERAYLIADNRLAELAEVSGAAIENLLRELDGEYETGLTGYTREEIDALTKPRNTSANVKTAADARNAEDETDATEIDGQEDFEREMSDKKTQGTAAIIPIYAEHNQAFVIVCDNSVDEAFIRNKMGLELPMQSYKDAKIRQSNVITARAFREMLK